MKSLFGAVYADLTKTFDCICHDLLIARLYAHGLSLLAIKLIKNFVENGKQRTKIRSSHSDWEDYYFRSHTRINTRTPFNVFSCNLVLEDENNYFETTPSFVGSTTAEVLENLSCLTKKLFFWFYKQSNENKG